MSPLASSGRGFGAGELFGLTAGWRAVPRIADVDKSSAVHSDTVGAWTRECFSCSYRSMTNWVLGDRRGANQRIATTAATVDINGTDLGAMATAASGRTASASWIMERFAGSTSWRCSLTVAFGCWR